MVALFGFPNYIEDAKLFEVNVARNAFRDTYGQCEETLEAIGQGASRDLQHGRLSGSDLSFV